MKIEEVHEDDGKIEEVHEDDGNALERAEESRKAGNELLAKGDFADACKRYDDGLLALVRNVNADQKRTEEIRLALHLNSTLAHLRRGNLASAVEHASGALAVDPHSVKALYRRSQARLRLAEHPGHSAEVQGARADLEEALRLEPGNVEVRNQLQQLRSTARAEQKELNKSQRESFKGIFAGDKPLYADAPSGEPPVVVHPDEGSAKHELALSAESLCFHYDKREPVLEGVNLELRSGCCVGLFGMNAAGKTTLARLLSAKLSPVSGRVAHHGKACAAPPQRLPAGTAGIAAAVVAAVAAAAVPDRRTGAIIVLVAVMFAVWFVLILRERQAQRGVVLHISSESNDKEEIQGRRTIESVIGEKLPSSLTKEKRRETVVAMLRAGGFQMYNQSTGEPVGSPADYVRDGLQFGHLSGGQKHLIYVLRCFASRPAVMVCDELLGGLDAFRQPRVLHMLRRLKEAGAAVLYIGTELHQLRLACDSIGFLHKGKVCEIGPAEEVLDFPKHPATKEYISNYRGLPGGHNIGGKLAASYTSLAGDEALAGPWLLS